MWAFPAGDDELHAWIVRELGVTIARRALIQGHAAPFDYLRHAFFEPQGEVADSVVWASRGAGKTFLGALATTLDLVFKPGVEVRILGGSLEQAGRMHGHLRRFFSRPALAALVEGKITERRIGLRNGSELELLAQSQTSVRGTRVQKLRCDEVELFDEEIWRAAQLVTQSKECGGRLVRGSVECFSTMHLPHGLMRRLVKEAEGGGRKLFRWNVVDVLGPCGPERACEPCALKPECRGRAKQREKKDTGGHVRIADALELKGRVDETTWNAEMLCLKPGRHHRVLPQFDEDVHVVDSPPAGPGASDESASGETCLVGMDFGFRAPTAILWADLDARGVLRVVDERIVSGAVLDEHVAAITGGARSKPAWVAVDPAGANVNDQTGISPIEVLKRAGLDVRKRRVPTHRGIALLRTRLRPADGSPPRLFVHRRCAGLIEALEQYHYDAQNPRSDEPVKDGPDHAVDALRYLVQNLDIPEAANHVTVYA